jgi:hypothetical protein
MVSPFMKLAETRAGLPSRETLRMLAALSLALFVGLQIIAASTALHRSLHRDAGTSGHRCVITLLTQGQMTAPALAVGWALVTAVILRLTALPVAPVYSSDRRLSPPGRAPPRF